MVGRDLERFSSFGIFVRGNQYKFYMHFWKLSSLEKNCSIHGQWNRFSLDRNDELPLHFFFIVFFLVRRTFAATEATLRIRCSEV